RERTRRCPGARRDRRREPGRRRIAPGAAGDQPAARAHRQAAVADPGLAGRAVPCGLDRAGEGRAGRARGTRGHPAIPRRRQGLYDAPLSSTGKGRPAPPARPCPVAGAAGLSQWSPAPATPSLRQQEQAHVDDLGVIDRFMETFVAYIDSGFGLLGGDVGFLTTVLIGIDITLAGLFWALGGEDDVVAKFVKKILYVGVFALILNSFSTLSDIIFRS